MAEGTDTLPIAPHLAGIVAALKESPSHFLILTAQTAAGKSTAVPLALMQSFSGRILMLEPRRIAVLSVANRIAALRGEECGQSVGYSMFLDSAVSEKTRLEVMTEALLTRRLQDEPSLDGVSVVILDEFHERSLHSDLAFALLQETMQLRDDFFVLLMSATINAKEISRKLGDSPIYTVNGRQFPVSISYHPELSTEKAISALLNDMISTGFPQACGKLMQNSASILVFLPGIAEIRRVQRRLTEEKIDAMADILVLHSSVSLSEQKRALSPAAHGRRRVILSSAIAETSLTVPDVAAVIDSGLARINRMNASAGMETLVTEPASAFSCEQRAGRAGRTQSGVCWRLWNEHDVRPAQTQPEIQRTDLCSLVLECYLWGVRNPEQLNWLDAPSKGTWNAAVELLQELDFIGKDGRVSALGKAAPRIGLHPRLARVAMSGAQHGSARQTAQLVLEHSAYKDATDSIKAQFIANLERRIAAQRKTLPRAECPLADTEAHSLLCGFPDRLARQTERKGVYQFPSGRMASLPKAFAANNAILPRWIIATEVQAGEREGSILAWKEIADSDAEQWASMRQHVRTDAQFDERRRLVLHRQNCYGNIVLSSVRVSATPEERAEAYCNAVHKNGMDWLPLSRQTQDLLLRARFYQQYAGQCAKPPLQHNPDKQSLAESARAWLLPFLGSDATLSERTVYDALCWYLDAPRINAAVPEFHTLPNGGKARLVYEEHSGAIVPVLEVIIQRIFGCLTTPRILGQPVLLKLLSPARRPLQITDDMEGFWASTWPEICKEMKGRYPKHNWDYRVPEKE